MIPSRKMMLSRIRLCRRDLLTQGIDLDGKGRAQLRSLVNRHLDYFQLMLGQDASAHAIALLVRSSD
jgi:hypothetical protein